jgi:propanediol dehydratase small subunit
VFRIYEMLRPGRCRSKEDLLAVAQRLRRDHAAPELARLVETAADVYARRGLFSKRF